jgi:hypothetical protein
MTQEARPITLPTRADVERLCASLKGTTDAHFEEAILKMEAAHLLNGRNPEATRIGSAIKYLESLEARPDTCTCNPRRHGIFYIRGRRICVYCRKPTE